MMDAGTNGLPEYELQRSDAELPREDSPKRARWWILGALVLGAASAAMYIASPKRTTPVAVETARVPVAATERERSLGGAPEPVAVPPLDESDAVVRTLVRGLSTRPAVAAWLTTNGLVRSFAAAVTNIADGALPSKQLSVLRPSAAFHVVETGGRTYIDPRSYNRYNAVADAVGSIDPRGAANVYATLKPRIEEAFRELGFPARRFDQVLETAIVTLLRTPARDSPLEVRRHVDAFGYGFADARLEDLSPAQKVLLRMGPRNARIVKAQLREVALALGIPPDHLPRNQ